MSYSGCASTKSCSADSVDAVFVAVCGARRCTCAPHASATSAISSASVETQIEAKTPESRAALMAQSISGRPSRSLMFFFGMETEPPRAGMTATTLGVGAVVGAVASTTVGACAGSAAALPSAISASGATGTSTAAAGGGPSSVNWKKTFSIVSSPSRSAEKRFHSLCDTFELSFVFIVFHRYLAFLNGTPCALKKLMYSEYLRRHKRRDARLSARGRREDAR